jgi:UDP-glucose 4-epimerase
MKIMVTGGAGFIGSHIQDAYIQEGHEVGVLDNLSTGKEGNLNPKAIFYQADIGSEAAAQAIADFNPEIINLHAAQIDVRKSVEDPLYDCQVNGLGMLNLLEAGRKLGVKRFIFASSGGAIYGEQKTFPADENHPTNPASPYGITKLLGDKYLQFYQATHGIPFVSLRYANVYGPRQNPHGEAGVVAIFVTKFLEGDQPLINGDGLQTRDYIFVEDVVRANLLALQDKVQGIYNIGTGVETNVVEIYRALGKILGIGKPPQHGPAKEGEQRRSVISSAKIEQAFGWKPEYDFESGMEKTAQWFREQK